MTVNLKSFFSLDKVEFTKEELELPYEDVSIDYKHPNQKDMSLERGNLLKITERINNMSESDKLI